MGWEIAWAYRLGEGGGQGEGVRSKGKGTGSRDGAEE